MKRRFSAVTLSYFSSSVKYTSRLYNDIADRLLLVSFVDIRMRKNHCMWYLDDIVIIENESHTIQYLTCVYNTNWKCFGELIYHDFPRSKWYLFRLCQCKRYSISGLIQLTGRGVCMSERFLNSMQMARRFPIHLNNKRISDNKHWVFSNSLFTHYSMKLNKILTYELLICYFLFINCSILFFDMSNF